MQPRSILCLLVALPSFWCTHLFLPVDQDAANLTHTPEHVKKCAGDCIKSITFTNFCYGFTLDSDNRCTPNHEVAVPTSGSYFVLRDYYDSNQCPPKAAATKTEALDMSKKFENPQQRHFNGSLFLLFKEPKALKDCPSLCKQHQSTMVYINSQEENDFVKELCTTNAPTLEYSCGLGIKTRKNGTMDNGLNYYEDSWNIDDEKKTPLNFVHYASGQPISGIGQPREECVAMFTGPIRNGSKWKNGDWDNLPCSYKKAHCLGRKEIKKN